MESASFREVVLPDFALGVGTALGRLPALACPARAAGTGGRKEAAFEPAERLGAALAASGSQPGNFFAGALPCFVPENFFCFNDDPW